MGLALASVFARINRPFPDRLRLSRRISLPEISRFGENLGSEFAFRGLLKRFSFGLFEQISFNSWDHIQSWFSVLTRVAWAIVQRRKKRNKLNRGKAKWWAAMRGRWCIRLAAAWARITWRFVVRVVTSRAAMSAAGSRATTTWRGSPPHVNSRRWSVSTFGDRVVNADPLTIQGHPVAFSASTRCIADLRVVDEPEAAWVAGLRVVDDWNVLDGPERCKNVHQLGLVGCCAQPENSDDSRLVRVLACPIVACATVTSWTAGAGSAGSWATAIRTRSVMGSSLRAFFTRTAAGSSWTRWIGWWRVATTSLLTFTELG